MFSSNGREEIEPRYFGETELFLSSHHLISLSSLSVSSFRTNRASVRLLYMRERKKERDRERKKVHERGAEVLFSLPSFATFHLSSHETENVSERGRGDMCT